MGYVKMVFVFISVSPFISLGYCVTCEDSVCIYFSVPLHIIRPVQLGKRVKIILHR